MKKLILIGLPGSGKTTVGGLLAGSWACPSGTATRRWSGWRKERWRSCFPAERSASAAGRRRHCRHSAPERTACWPPGGGAVLRPENRALLRRSGVVFWLDRPVADIERTLERANRPLLAGGGSLETLRRQREALYRICADYAIRENTAQAAAEAIAAIWRKQT